jgi:hypothetical protein
MRGADGNQYYADIHEIHGTDLHNSIVRSHNQGLYSRRRRRPRTTRLRRERVEVGNVQHARGHHRHGGY